MKILFLYPRPVDGHTRRKTRLEHQLACISRTMQTMLGSAAIEHSFTVREIAYESSLPATHTATDNSAAKAASEMYSGTELQQFNNSELKNLYAATDLVIEVCGDKQTQTHFYNYNGASITLRPTYPGSFAQNDINIECRNVDDNAWVTERIIEATRSAEELSKLEEYLEPDMYYSQFSPLPVRLGTEFYQREREHALVFLSFTAGENTDEVCDNDKKTLALLLHDIEALRSLTIVTDTLETAPKVEQIALYLREALAVDTKVFAHRRGDYRDLFAVLSKCDLALFAGSSLYIDAARLGIPVYIWRSQQQGVEPLNEAFLTLADKYDPAAVHEEQRRQIEKLVEAHYLGHTLPNNSRAIMDAMAAIITKLAPGVVIDTGKLIDDTAMPVPVIDQPRVWHEDSARIKMRNSLSLGKKKFAKMRQNPNRFFKDSNNPFARKIYTLMR